MCLLTDYKIQIFQVGYKPHLFLFSFEGGVWLTLRPGRFTPQKMETESVNTAQKKTAVCSDILTRPISALLKQNVQGGSNMTGTDYV